MLLETINLRFSFDHENCFFFVFEVALFLFFFSSGANFSGTAVGKGIKSNCHLLHGDKRRSILCFALFDLLYTSFPRSHQTKPYQNLEAISFRRCVRSGTRAKFKLDALRAFTRLRIKRFGLAYGDFARCTSRSKN